MKRYPQYKNSGVEWLGEVPEWWEVKKLKYLADAFPSNIDKKSKDGEEAVWLCNYVDVYKNEFITSDLSFMAATASEDQREKFVLRRGDVLATKDSETPDDIANPALVLEDFDNVLCGYHLTHIKPKRIYGRYLFRYFQTKFLKSYFEVSANGITRYGLGVDKFGSALILIPSPQEQTAIANYLDRKTAEIDCLIANKERLIELYEEEKTAVINQAVTKGLDPDAPMKPSGIDWLGDIPEHWDVKRLKHLTVTISKGTTPSTAGREILPNGVVRFLKAENILNNNVVSEPENYIDEVTNEILKRSKLEVDDLLFVIAGATIGKVAILSTDHLPANTNQAVAFIRLARKDFVKFVWYWLQSSIINELLWLKAVQSAQPNLSMENLGNFYIPFPKPDEQTAIVQHIETECSRLDTIIDKFKKQIELLKEYRTTLISEVVTGKIDVRDEVVQ
ncbi:MAG: restriction endonuclease subunit S [Desulfobulbaceae bacterium]|nr:restriction endonuclease subunit S [Desulfobulbaceae bacterium]